MSERIVIDPKVLAGKPVIRGTRFEVSFIVQVLANGWEIDDIVRSYPGIQPDDVLACLAHAADVTGRG